MAHLPIYAARRVSVATRTRTMQMYASGAYCTYVRTYRLVRWFTYIFWLSRVDLDVRVYDVIQLLRVRMSMYTIRVWVSSFFLRYTGIVVVVVVVFTFIRSFYPTSAVPPVSFLMLHPTLEIQIMWSDSETEKTQTLKNQGRQIKC